MKRTAFIIAVILLTASAAQAASFDCAEASTDIERTICADEELSRLDGSLGSFYAWARLRAADPKALRTEQRTWLRDVREACVDSGCLKKAYKLRIDELSKVGGMTVEKKHAICEELVEAVNDQSLMQSFVTFGGPCLFRV